MQVSSLLLYWVHLLFTIANVLLNVLCLYLIKNCTRKGMFEYRKILYQNCVFEVIYSVVSGISQVKMETYDGQILITLTGLPSASQSLANVVTILWLLSMHCVMMGMTVQVFYRYLIIVRDLKIRNSHYFAMLVPCIGVAVLISIVFFWTVETTPDCTDEELDILRSIDNQQDIPCVPLSLNHTGMKWVVFLTSIVGCFAGTFIPLMNYLVYRHLRETVSMTSTKKNLEKQVSIALISQVVIVSVGGLIPLAFILINMLTSSAYPSLSTFASTIIIILPIVNPLTTIVTIEAYRRYIILKVKTLCSYKKNVEPVLYLQPSSSQQQLHAKHSLT
uniref:G_PROTEIN_RECEP_F1_2 domain-containing protein n=1 Tax=Panagrellus redivivus TaxID=6233 RepID=A0A7E4UV84_PANRE